MLNDTLGFCFPSSSVVFLYDNVISTSPLAIPSTVISAYFTLPSVTPFIETVLTADDDTAQEVTVPAGLLVTFLTVTETPVTTPLLSLTAKPPSSLPVSVISTLELLTALILKLPAALTLITAEVVPAPSLIAVPVNVSDTVTYVLQLLTMYTLQSVAVLVLLTAAFATGDTGNNEITIASAIKKLILRFVSFVCLKNFIKKHSPLSFHKLLIINFIYTNCKAQNIFITTLKAQAKALRFISKCSIFKNDIPCFTTDNKF